jgi:hypothetical protein
LKRWYIYLVLLLSSLLQLFWQVGCIPATSSPASPQPSAAPVNTPLPVPYFPIQKATLHNYFTDGTQGRLILENGYLRLQQWSLFEESYTKETILPIWPYGYSLDTTGNRLQVKDARGQSIAIARDHIFIGGGIEPDDYTNQLVNQPLPADSKGPYWFVSPRNYPAELVPGYPLQTGAKIDEPLAIAEGTLILSRGYLVLDSTNGVMVLLIWPHDYTFRLNNYLIQVMDANGQFVASVGDKLKIRYAELPPEMSGKYTGRSGPLRDWQSVQSDVKGPYWLVSEIIQ